MGAREHEAEDASLRLILTTKNKKPNVQNETMRRTKSDEQDLCWRRLAAQRQPRQVQGNANLLHPLVRRLLWVSGNR